MAWFEHQSLTIADLLALNSAAMPAKQALVDGETVWDWQRFGEGTARVGNALLAVGCQRGDRVVILMKNSAEMVEAMFGVIRAGLVAVPLNVSITDAAIAAMIKDSDARAVIASGEHMRRIESLGDQLPDAVRGRLIGYRADIDGWLDYTTIRDAASAKIEPVELGPLDECNLIYSSGTTGLPKGIIHHHACREAWASDMAVALRYHSGARTLCNLGLFSNISWVAMLATIFVGGTIVIERRFEPTACLQLIEDQRITHTAMVPLQYQKLMAVADLASFDLTSLDSYMCCGSPLAPALKDRIMRELPGDLIELYGLTEGLVTILAPEDMREKTDSVGRPCPGQYLAIVDDNGALTAVGEEGEIVGYSRFLMAGYHANDAANEEATWTHPSGQRWLRTGDIGRLDADGFLYLVDRKKDMILSGGQNIYPADIESVIQEHPDVSEVAVVGVAHDKWGETPLAVVVLEAGASDAEQSLMDWANARLGKQQRIAATRFVDALPRNPNGKVLKRELRRQYANVLTETSGGDA